MNTMNRHLIQLEPNCKGYDHRRSDRRQSRLFCYGFEPANGAPLHCIRHKTQKQFDDVLVQDLVTGVVLLYRSHRAIPFAEAIGNLGLN
jgi:hypothetical protein